jgi:hypothetical protein
MTQRPTEETIYEPGPNDPTITTHPGANDPTSTAHPGADEPTVAYRPAASDSPFAPQTGANDPTVVVQRPGAGANDPTVRAERPEPSAPAQGGAPAWQDEATVIAQPSDTPGAPGTGASDSPGGSVGAAHSGPGADDPTVERPMQQPVQQSGVEQSAQQPVGQAGGRQVWGDGQTTVIGGLELPVEQSGLQRWREYGDRLAELTEIRVRHPERLAEAWQGRRTRALVGEDGRLLIVAADHPARGALGVRGDRMAMASRPDLIARLMTALERPGVDGVLATPDILEDLLLLGALEGKVVIGSMNRGGLQGAAFEVDDRFTAYRTADEIAARRLDGGKMLTRIDLNDPGTVATLESSAAAVTGLAEHKLMAMVEPFWSTRAEDGRVTNLLDPDSVIKSIHIASALGATSAYTWLKLPVVDELDRVMEATTLPTLLLGGDPTVAPEATYASWGKALSLPSVRGLVVGRALLFPPDGDVAAAVDHAAMLVHGGAA